MTTEKLECFITLVDKAAARFERMESNFEISSVVGEMLPNSTACRREVLHERKSHLMWHVSSSPYFKKLPQSPQLSAATTLISQRASTSKRDPPPAK